MTTEEASVIIGNIPIEGDDCYTIAEYQEAKAMAIKALEQIEIWNATTKDRKIIAPKGTFQKIWEDEQQPCEDCISREDLIGTMHVIMDDAIIGNEDENYECLDDIKQQYIEIAKGMKSVQPKPIFYPICEDCNTKMDKIRRAYDKCRWIPCSERFPEREGWYLISLGDKTYGGADVDMYCDGWVKYGTHVLAWMPLPEPYKAESDKEGEE